MPYEADWVLERTKTVLPVKNKMKERDEERGFLQVSNNDKKPQRV